MARLRVAARVGACRRAVRGTVDIAWPSGRHDTFYAGTATIELHRTETANYVSNLQSGAPLLWVVLRPTGAQPPYELMTVTADPAEGEASTEAGDNLVETVPMPDGIIEALEAFIAEHHVERPFYKRQRDRDGQPGGRKDRRDGGQ